MEPKVRLFGFVCTFLLLCHTPARSQLLRDVVRWTTVSPFPAVWSLADDTAARSVVDLTGSYSEIFRAEERCGEQKAVQSQASAWEGSLGWTARGPALGASVRLATDGAWMRANDWVADRGAGVEQQVTMVGAALWATARHLSGGLALDFARSPVTSANAAAEDLLPDQPVSWVASDSTLGHSFFLGAAVHGFSLQYRQSRHTLAALLPRMALLSSNHFRTFPLAVVAGERSLVLSYGGAKWRIEARGGVERLGSDSATGDNMLATVTEWLFRVAGIHAEAQVGPVGMTLDCVGRFGGGYVEGHGKGIKYLVIDSADAMHVGGQIGLSFRSCLRAGAFLDYARAESPIGSANLAPFTAWSVFRPTVYRLRDMEAECFEVGGEVGGVVRTGRRSALSCDLSLAHLSAKVAYSTLERRVIVLIPAYFDSTRVTALDWRGVDIGIRLRHEVAFRRVLLAYWLTQHLPVQTNASAAAPAADRPEGTEARSGGGTSAGLELRVAVGRTAAASYGRSHGQSR